jgi:hypothetical protein
MDDLTFKVLKQNVTDPSDGKRADIVALEDADGYGYCWFTEPESSRFEYIRDDPEALEHVARLYARPAIAKQRQHA